MPDNDIGLRERRKLQTRQVISDAATQLFLDRGFDNVTIAEVAAAAGVAKMTVTNYFPRKEDLLFDQQEAFTSGLARTVRTRRPAESASAALRRDFLARVAGHDPVIGFTGPQFAELISGSPTLEARLREFHDLRQTALAETLREETGAPEGDLTPDAAAAQLTGVLRVLFGEVRRLTLLGWDDAATAEAVTAQALAAFDAVERGLADYAVRDG